MIQTLTFTMARLFLPYSVLHVSNSHFKKQQNQS